MRVLTGIPSIVKLTTTKVKSQTLNPKPKRIGRPKCKILKLGNSLWQPFYAMGFYMIWVQARLVVLFIIGHKFGIPFLGEQEPRQSCALNATMF